MSDASPQSEVTSNALQSIFGALMGAIDSENQQALAAFLETPAILTAAQAIEKGDPEDFHFAIQYPMSRLVDAVLEKHIGDCVDKDNLMFVFTRSELIERHVRRIIEKHDGPGCCADKSRTIVRALARFFKTGQRIEWNFNQKYTYHLPKIAFADHDTVLQFFIGITRLEFGLPDAYLNALLAVEQAAVARRNERDEKAALELAAKEAQKNEDGGA
jgi:hypothetical protein